LAPDRTAPGGSRNTARRNWYVPLAQRHTVERDRGAHLRALKHKQQCRVGASARRRQLDRGGQLPLRGGHVQRPVVRRPVELVPRVLDCARALQVGDEVTRHGCGMCRPREASEAVHAHAGLSRYSGGTEPAMGTSRSVGADAAAHSAAARERGATPFQQAFHPQAHASHLPDPSWIDPTQHKLKLLPQPPQRPELFPPHSRHALGDSGGASPSGGPGLPPRTAAGAWKGFDSGRARGRAAAGRPRCHPPPPPPGGAPPAALCLLGGGGGADGQGHELGP
jgi:hypothetical protein